MGGGVILHLVILLRAETVAGVTGIAVGVNVVAGIVGGWMRFASGLRLVVIVARRRVRMRVLISALQVRR
jgi:hypothetical protein